MVLMQHVLEFEADVAAAPGPAGQRARDAGLAAPRTVRMRRLSTLAEFRAADGSAMGSPSASPRSSSSTAPSAAPASRAPPRATCGCPSSRRSRLRACACTSRTPSWKSFEGQARARRPGNMRLPGASAEPGRYEL
jgi:hypothetical protein